MGFDETVTRRLSTEECWDLLRADEFGRLAYRMSDEVHLVPINYAVDGDTILFLTGEGNKLLGLTMHPEVVFEIDAYDDERAHSVIVRGLARRLEEDEEHRAENVPLRTWIGTPTYNVVEIRPTQISGFAFVLERPWLHART